MRSDRRFLAFAWGVGTLDPLNAAFLTAIRCRSLDVYQALRRNMSRIVRVAGPQLSASSLCNKTA
jgi:hypothetical protein